MSTRERRQLMQEKLIHVTHILNKNILNVVADVSEGQIEVIVTAYSLVYVDTETLSS